MCLGMISYARNIVGEKIAIITKIFFFLLHWSFYRTHPQSTGIWFLTLSNSTMTELKALRETACTHFYPFHSSF